MREILFRGKRSDNGKWVQGFLFKYRGTLCIQLEGIDCDDYGLYPHCYAEVAPEAVGQYTGLTDKNGKKIFEGDIVKAQDDVFGSPFCNGIVGKVVYEEAAYFIETKNVIDSQYLFNECAVYEVIGNIHDTPELLKGVVTGDNDGNRDQGEDPS